MADKMYGTIRATLGEKNKRELIAVSKHYEMTPSAIIKMLLRPWLDQQPDNVKLDPDRFADKRH